MTDHDIRIAIESVRGRMNLLEQKHADREKNVDDRLGRLEKDFTERMKVLQEDMKSVRGHLTWLVRIVFAAVILALLQQAFQGGIPIAP